MEGDKRMMSARVKCYLRGEEAGEEEERRRIS